MKTPTLLLAAPLLLVTACANQPDVSATVQVGKVQGVFVEQYDGVFVDRRVAGEAAADKPGVVYVKFAQPLPDGRKFATAQVREDLAIEPGDLVQMRFHVADAANVGAGKEPNQVMALVAKHDTEAARSFGQPSRPALDQLTKAGRDD
jgi:hypothetical protein